MTLSLDYELVHYVEDVYYRKMVDEALNTGKSAPSKTEAYRAALTEWMNAKKAGKI